jgi:hypothetical protein
MIRGFIADDTGGSDVVAKWVEGEPVNAKFLGLTGLNVVIRGRMMFPLRSLRCEECGFLELYAV